MGDAIGHQLCGARSMVRIEAIVPYPLQGD